MGLCYTQFWGCEEAQYLFHDSVSLLCLEQELCVRGTVEHYQLFGFRSFVKPGADAG